MASTKSIAPEERVFSLVLALVASNRGLTKSELLSTVFGYSDDYQDESKRESLDRKFERDKDELRRLGIPLETVDSPGEIGNNQLTRYLIPKDALQVPADLEFSPEEITLLRAASLAWEDTALASHSKQALIKIVSLQPDIDLGSLEISPKIVLNDLAAYDLNTAINQKNQVQFKYQKPEDETAENRVVSPLRLHRADGRWHLIAFDELKKEWRVFLVSRITGRVKILATAKVDPLLEESVTEQIERLETLENERLAVVAVEENSEAHTRLTAKGRATANEAILELNKKLGKRFVALEIPTLDYIALSEDLLKFGGEAIPIFPKQLKDSFIEVVRRLEKLHRGTLAE